MTAEEAIKTLLNAKFLTHRDADYAIGVFDAVEIAVKALENCPPKDSMCYGCHDNCKECDLLRMAMSRGFKKGDAE